MYRNYIFDLYGTLVDIRTNEKKASLWKHMAMYMTLQGAVYTGAELRKSFKQFMDEVREESYRQITTASHGSVPELAEIEVNLAEVFHRLYRAKGIAATEEMVSHWALMYRTLSLNYVRLYDGAKELLEELHRRGKKIYLLSNAQRLFTEPELRSLRIYDLFDDVFISSDIGFMKPSSLFYGALLQKHNINPGDSVMIGNDWQADAWGACKNGLAAMYIHTEQSPEPVGELPPGCRVLNCILDVLDG